MLSRSLPHHGIGGMEIVAWDLAKELVRQGLAVRIITTHIPGHGSSFVEDGVTVVPLVNTPSGRYSRPWWEESRKYFQTQCMDSALGVLSVSAAAYGLLPLKSRLPNCPFVLQAHGTSIGEIISKWRSKRLRTMLSSLRNMAWLPKDLMAYGGFDYVVAVGERVYHDMTHTPISWFLPTERVKLINNGIDTSLFYPSEKARVELRDKLGISNSTPVLISASRLHVQKGVGHALRAFMRLQRKLPVSVFLIAGDGPEREKLQSLSRDLGVSDSVTFLGALSREEMADYLRAADAFLFLTRRVEAGLPLNIHEALASGLPCVVSEHLNLPPSPLTNRVSPSCIDDVALVLEKLLEEPMPKKRENALPSEFELKKMGEEYLDLMGAR